MKGIHIGLGSVQSTGNQLNSGLSVLLVLRGKLAVKTPEQNWVLTEHQLFVLNHRDFFSLENDGPNVVLWVGMDQAWLDAVFPEWESGRFLCCSMHTGFELEPLYQALRQGLTWAAMLYYRHDGGYWLQIQSELLRVLHILAEHFRCEGRPAPPGTANGRLQAVLDRILQGYQEPLTLEGVAQEFFVSPAHLARLFQKELHTTFVEYLTALRLEYVRRALLYTDGSITRIALDSGFSSVRSMNRCFQRAQGCTPAQYRGTMSSQPDRVQLHWIDSGTEESLETLARFVDTYQERAEELVRQETIRLPRSGHPFVRPAFLLHVGDLSTLLRGDVERQLTEAQRAIGFQYVYFSGLFRQESGEADLISGLDRLTLLESLLRLGLTPFVRVDAPEDGEWMIRVLTTLVARLGREELGRWKFELVPRGSCTPESFRSTAETIRRVLPRAALGVRVDWRQGGDEFLGDGTDFVTCGADANAHHFAADAAAFEQFHRRYHREQITRVGEWLRERGVDVPVYLTDWNTLTGRSVVEAGEFHRTALITDTLVALREQVAGLAVRLNLFGTEGCQPTYPLSLYLYRNIRRPLFSILRGMAHMENQTLWEGPGTLITQLQSGRYIVLLWNPCYIDPAQSLNNLRKDEYSQVRKVVLQGLDPGDYRMKRFYLDRSNGSTYNSWLKIDMSAHMDPDVLEYLSRVSEPAVTLERRTVVRELEIVQTLSLNAAALWSIRKID